jgi:hypothetical protein
VRLYCFFPNFKASVRQDRPMCADGKALDLLESMLHALPSKRIQAEFALTHEFFRGETAPLHTSNVTANLGV